MERPARVFWGVFGSVVMWGGVAFMALFAGPWSSQFGMLIAFFLVIIWYALIGHHLISMFINRVAGLARGNVSPKGIYERNVDKLVKKKKFEEAIKKCREWSKHDRDSSEPLMKICNILVEHLDRAPQAIQELEIAVSRPCSAEMRVTVALRLADLYRKAGREREVDAMYRRARSFHPNSPEIERLA